MTSRPVLRLILLEIADAIGGYAYVPVKLKAEAKREPVENGGGLDRPRGNGECCDTAPKDQERVEPLGHAAH